MKKILFFLSMLLTFLNVNAQIEFRATVGIDSIVVVDTVTYTASLNNFNDQLGLGVTALDVTTNHYFIDNVGKRYEITSVANATFTSVSVTLVEAYDTDGSPNFLGGLIYEQGNDGIIPFVPDNSTGISQVLKAHIETINANILNDYGDSTSVSGKQKNLNQLPDGVAVLADKIAFVDTDDNDERKLESLTDIQSLIGGGGSQTISIDGDTITLSGGGGSVVVPDYMWNHEALQNIDLGSTFYISPDGADIGIKLTASGNLVIKSSDFVGSKLFINEAAANGDHRLSFQAPDNLAADQNYQWSIDGTSGQVLSTDGAGNLSWEDDAGETTTASNGIERVSADFQLDIIGLTTKNDLNTITDELVVYNASTGTEVKTSLNNLGSLIGGAGSPEIQSYATYAAFRADNTDYTVRYTQEAGKEGFWFQYEGVQTDNGGTVLETDSLKYKRVQPTPDVYLSWFEGDKDADKVLAGLVSLEEGGDVYVDTTYFIEKKVTIPDKKGLIFLKGGKFVRDTQLVTTQNGTTSNSISYFIPDDITGWENGMNISVCDGNTDADIKAYDDGSFYSTITSISGDTLFTNRNLNATDWDGLTLFNAHPLIEIQGHKVTIEGGVFDEQRDTNNANYSWRVGGVISANDDLTLIDNEFKNIIHTVAFAPYAIARENLVDSFEVFIHKTNGTIPNLNTDRISVIENNILRHAGDNYSKCGHCEAALVTFSNNSIGIKAENNNLSDIKNAILSPANKDDKRIHFLGNTAINRDSSLSDGLAIRITNDTGAADSTFTDVNLRIEDNYLYQVGNVEVEGGNDSNGNSIYGLYYARNILINGIFDLQRVQQATITDNTFGRTSAFDLNYPSHQITLDSDRDRFAVIMQGVNHSTFNNNNIWGSSVSDSLWGGLVVSGSYYNSFYNTSVKGYKVGISTGQTTADRGDANYNVFDGGIIEVDGTGLSVDDVHCIRAGRGTTIRNFTLNALTTNIVNARLTSTTDAALVLTGNTISTNYNIMQRFSTLEHENAILSNNVGFGAAADDAAIGNSDWDVDTKTAVSGNSFLEYTNREPLTFSLPRFDLIHFE